MAGRLAVGALVDENQTAKAANVLEFSSYKSI
jgi:hypothetical protein